ncbi:MAG TPA: alpha/beta hydrolase [Candidatus Limnocylindrales bacterium]|nr:alpha/beta hydrolase [Candidatus Limnocylindrales bacterium]
MKSFESADGLNIAYYEWGDVSGIPVVLQHGFSASALSNWEMTGIVAALVEADRRVIAIDARGHGASDKPYDPAFYGEQRMADDISALLGLVGADQADLVGYSMGGVVALIVAANDARIRRLVTGGIGASAAELGGVDKRAVAGRALVEGLLTEDTSTIDDPRVMAFRLFADAAGADRRALAAQALAAHNQPIGLERITAPTLALAGADDYLASRPEALAAAIFGARWRVLAGDHLTVVRNPEFVEAIVKFLA